MPDLTRRQLLIAFPILGSVATRSFAAAIAGQTASASIRVRSLNHFGIAVADPKRSIDFYQGLFGMPVQARQATTTVLRVGAGPQFLSIRPVEGSATPSITHYGLGVEQFDADRVMAALAAKGVARAEAAGPMRAVVVPRDSGADVSFGDPDGIVCQLHDVWYCGGSGPLGSRCSPTESPKKGLIALADLNHLTIYTGDAQRSNKFYQDLFGFSIRSYQGPTAPTLAVGPTVQFLMFTGGGANAPAASAARRPASINHACLTLSGFKPDDILKTLESFGLKPRGDAPGPPGPLRHYVTMRMENRGGAPGGTPELYFTDPDGLLIQLQDRTYCGGSSYLGSDCPKS